MRKIQRISRIVGLTKLLTSRPGYLFALSDFTEQFESAKSTVSEDMLTIRTALEDFEMGTLETVAGAAGGIKFWPLLGKTHEDKILQELIQLLAIPERILQVKQLSFRAQSRDQKQLLSVKKEVIPSVKWQTLCTWLVLM